ncbi:MAG: hypothetical protein ACLU8J_08950 [Acutalibacter sp.]
MGCAVGVYGAATVGRDHHEQRCFGLPVKPSLAIAVDVTYTSDYPGVDTAATGDVRVGGGPVLVNNPSCHRKPGCCAAGR